MSNYTVQTGFWVNHDFEPAVGATLTVSVRWGNYIIAALSSLVAWAGSRAWSILYFYLHQRLAQKENKDVLHHQLQVHFRAAGSFFDSFVEGYDLARAWSGRLERVKRRTLSLVFGAFLFFVLFAAAGILVAEAVSQSDQDTLVLAAPNDCGDLIFMDLPERHNEYLDVTMRYLSEGNAWARNYARDTFNGSKARFDAFTQPILPVYGREVECPYTNGTTCLGVNGTKGASAWLMETGQLNSHTHFGINAPASDRVTISKSVTCAVMETTNLTTKPYSRIENIRGVPVNKTYIGVLQQFGPDLGADANLVFEVPASLINERVGYVTQRGLYYMGQHDPMKDFTDGPFLRYDADVVLSLVSQSHNFYYGPVDDPLFLAHEAATGEEYAYDMNATVYYPSIPFGLLACSEQMSICNPNNQACTSPNGTMGWREQIIANDIGLNGAQWTTAMRIFNTAAGSSTFIGSFAARGNTGLMVAESRGVRAGQSIGPTQWRNEVNLWFAASMTALQSGLLTWVAKPWAQGQGTAMYPLLNVTAMDYAYQVRGLGSQMQTQCSNQLIRSAAAMQNFSVLALVLVTVLCVFIIVFASVLPCCVDGHRARIRKKGGDLSHKAEAGELARLADGKFSLLAMTLANAGVGQWEKGKADIPVTTRKVVEPCRPLQRTDSGLATYPSALSLRFVMECKGGDESGTLRSMKSQESVKGGKEKDTGVKVKAVEVAAAEDEEKRVDSKKTVVDDDGGAVEKTSTNGSDTGGRFERIKRRATEKTLVGTEGDEGPQAK